MSSLVKTQQPAQRPSAPEQEAAPPVARVYDSRVPPVGWRPEAQPGIELHDPATEIAPHEYDAFADALAADHADDPIMVSQIRHRQSRGWVLRRHGRGVFLRGRG